MRYEPLTRHLETQRVSDVRMSFGEIETLLRRRLPGSARRHPAWWANTESHSHAAAWLRAGWKTHDLDLGGEAIAFRRAAGETLGARRERRAPDNFALQAADLNLAAQRLVRARAEASGVSCGKAIAEWLNQSALEERRRWFDRFPLEGPRSTVDSAELIREDRDGR